MNLKLENLNEYHAMQICSWKYEGRYSIYNFPEWDVIVKQKWGIAIESKRQNEFSAVTNEFNILCGYIRFINNNDCITIGLGLKPSLCGCGLGNNLMKLLKRECRKRYNNKKIILEVRSFNKRAIQCYKNAEFKTVGIVNKETLIGNDEFIEMEFSY